VRLPEGMTWEALSKRHDRKRFDCGEPVVTDWLRTKAWQNQEKHLSSTRVIAVEGRTIAGFATVSTGQVEFGDLPEAIVRTLPRRALPVAILAWLGVDRAFQGRGLGARLVAAALADCHRAGGVFPFVAVIVDAIDDRARSFYGQWSFSVLPGHTHRLFLSAAELEALVRGG
jgi:GNAT superfamily N-acetyltransferase